MSQSLLALALTILAAPAIAGHCHPSVVETIDSVCHRFPEEPKLTRVEYNQDAREFRYYLPVTEVTRYTRTYYNCWGRVTFIERGSRSTHATQYFSQPDEGHADFTLVREVRAYIKRHPPCR
ncbi:MAG: hypothetical protein HYR96_02510 [Deltaproteobacteria bacterium]|nr:hypothetical protein [Deltaproteobacteria bacterium]